MSASSAQALAAVTAATDAGAGAVSKDAVDLAPLLNDMFSKLSRYANAEIAASSEEYALLSKLNSAAGAKYESMAEQAAKLVAAMHTVNATQASLDTFFAQIDELEKNLTDMEAVIAQLDLYSKRLHFTFQQVYKT